MVRRMRAIAVESEMGRDDVSVAVAVTADFANASVASVRGMLL